MQQSQGPIMVQHRMNINYEQILGYCQKHQEIYIL